MITQYVYGSWTCCVSKVANFFEPFSLDLSTKPDVKKFYAPIFSVYKCSRLLVAFYFELFIFS